MEKELFKAYYSKSKFKYQKAVNFAGESIPLRPLKKFLGRTALSLSKRISQSAQKAEQKHAEKQKAIAERLEAKQRMQELPTAPEPVSETERIDRENFASGLTAKNKETDAKRAQEMQKEIDRRKERAIS